MAWILKVDGTKEELIGAGPDRELSLEQLRKGIGGGWIESLTISPTEVLIVDEEGKLKNMPFNQQATEKAMNAGFADMIVGDAILCRHKNGEMY